jgi:uncharacterized protein YlzI (FlbEa/FlbD family)
MIKLANLSNGHQGNPIYINPDHIIAVYPFAPEGGSIQTIVYGGPQGTTWIVEEGVEEVIKKIKEAKKQ